MARKTALEGIIFQLGNPLGKDMEKLFQDTINAVNAIDYTQIAESKWIKHRYTVTHEYVKRTLFPELRKIIEKHTNLRITKIVDVRNFSGMFAVQLGMDDFEAAITILDRQTGTSSGGVTLTDSAKEIAATSKLLNEKTGKLDKNTFGVKNTRIISAVLYMDVDMAFLMEDNLPNKIVSSLTAAELTGIYLHEIGHMLTMINQASNAYQQIEYMKSHLASTVRKKTPADLVALSTVYQVHLRPQLEEKIKAKLLSSKILDVGDALVKGSARYAEMADNADYVTGTFEFVFTVLIQLWIGFVMIFIRSMTYSYIYPLFRGLIWMCSEKPGEHGKSTDQSTSNSIYYHAERLADEYVVKLGYGASLSEALLKINKASQYLNVLVAGKVESGSLRNSHVFVMYLKATLTLASIFRIDARSMTSDFTGPSSYEDDVARLHRILTNLSAAFKQELSPEITNSYLSDIERIKKAMNEIKQPWAVRVSDTLWKYMLDVPSILKRLAQLDDMEEFEVLSTKLDSIINNELYVTAAQFKQLAR